MSKLCKMGVMCFTAYSYVDVLQVSEPKQEMTRLVDDSQVCNASLNLFSLYYIVIVGAILKRSLNWTVIGCKDLSLLVCLSNY